MAKGKEIDGRAIRRGDGQFVTIANEALRDPRLSYRAKGILAACLTHAADFPLTRAWIDSHGTEGRDAITKAIHELRELGYAWDEWLPGSTRVRRMVWSDAPKPSCDACATGFQSDGFSVPLKISATENQSDGFSVPLKISRTYRRPVLKKTNSEEDHQSVSAPLAPAADAAVTDRSVELGRGERRKRFKPQGDDVPLLLQPVATDVLEFWEGKQGAKSEAAWKRLMAELELIANDPHGGMAVVEAQLHTGIQSGNWSSITYANWQKYGRETRQTRNGSGLAHGGYGSKAQQNAAEAKRLLNEWDRQGGMFAAAAANNTNTQAALPQGGYPWS